MVKMYVLGKAMVERVNGAVKAGDFERALDLANMVEYKGDVVKKEMQFGLVEEYLTCVEFDNKELNVYIEETLNANKLIAIEHAMVEFFKENITYESHEMSVTSRDNCEKAVRTFMENVKEDKYDIHTLMSSEKIKDEMYKIFADEISEKCIALMKEEIIKQLEIDEEIAKHPIMDGLITLCSCKMLKESIEEQEELKK